MQTHAWTHANDVTDEIWTISSLYNAFPNDSHEFVANPYGYTNLITVNLVYANSEWQIFLENE